MEEHRRKMPLPEPGALDRSAISDCVSRNQREIGFFIGNVDENRSISVVLLQFLPLVPQCLYENRSNSSRLALQKVQFLHLEIDLLLRLLCSSLGTVPVLPRACC
ncbi:hypothetical protein L1887_38706 [Cichorium endivia]|nr:hypothetical protein L1887_38706 [Cichorium endivia]